MGHAVRTKQVDGEVPVDSSPIAKVIVKVHAGVVDQDVERFDAHGSSLNLRLVGDVQDYRCDALIRMCKGLARPGIDAFRASLQGFLKQCPPDAAIGPSDQDCFVFDVHCVSFLRLSALRSTNI
jgi:hypothetical protein